MRGSPSPLFAWFPSGPERLESADFCDVSQGIPKSKIPRGEIGTMVPSHSQQRGLQDFLAEAGEDEFNAEECGPVVFVDHGIDFDDFERGHGF